MDTITQGLLGAATAQLGFRQRIGRDATWVAAAASILPDLDIFIMPLLSLSGTEVDTLTRMRIHRGLSHSLLLTPGLALLVAGLWWWFRNRRTRGAKSNGHSGDPPPNPSRRPAKAPPFWLLYLCAFVALLSHPLLDWCTSYGTCLLTPLIETRYAIDAVGIIDFLYTPILVLTLLACWLVRKLKRRSVRATLIIGWAGFLLSTGYLAAGRLMHDWAVNKAVAMAGDKKVLAADAYPIVGTIFLWRTVVQTQDQWIVTRIHHFRGAPPGPHHRQTAPRIDNEWVRKARGIPEMRTFDWFANGRVRAQYAREDGHRVVTFHDMRYGATPQDVESLWPARIVFDAEGNVLSFVRSRRVRRGRVSEYAGQLWRDIWNP